LFDIQHAFWHLLRKHSNLHMDKIQPTTFSNTLEEFAATLASRNVSKNTILAYLSDLNQFLFFLTGSDAVVKTPKDITRQHVIDFLYHLTQQKRTGVTRARKLASIRECFKFLQDRGQIQTNPTDNIPAPQREKKARHYLRSEEYSRMLSAAAESRQPRDYAILQLLLQTGLRVSELVSLETGDVDFASKTLIVRLGKGNKDRVIPLETKGINALKGYLANSEYQDRRARTHDSHLFLSRDGKGLTTRSIMKLESKYAKAAGIERKVSPHTLRHTFATLKASLGISVFVLQDWLGHEKITTTQIYVHEAGRSNVQRLMENTGL
jgi:site-specific recombinase XerD